MSLKELADEIDFDENEDADLDKLQKQALSALDGMEDLSDEKGGGDDQSLLAELKEYGWEEDDKDLAELEADDGDAEMEAERAPGAAAAGKSAASSSSSSSAPAVPAKPNAAATSRLKLMEELSEQMKAAKQRMIALNTAGRKEEALELFRLLKQAQAHVDAAVAEQSAADDKQTRAFVASLEQHLSKVDAVAAKAAPPAVPAKPSIPAAAAPAAAASPDDTRTVVDRRLREYMQAAVAAKNAGNMDRARTLTLDVRKLKAIRAQLDDEAHPDSVSLADLPPPLSGAASAAAGGAGAGAASAKPASGSANASVKTPAAAQPKAAASKPAPAKAAAPAKTPAAAAPAKAADAKVATSAAAPPRKSSSSSSSSSSSNAKTAPSNASLGLSSPPPAAGTVQAELEYDDLLNKLNAQAEQLASLMKSTYDPQAEAKNAAAAKGARKPGAPAGIAAAATPASREAKLTALEYFRLKKETLHARDLLLLARQKRLPPPRHSWQERQIAQEQTHDDVAETCLEMTIVRCRMLSQKDAGVSKPEDLAPYVTWKIDFPRDQGGQTATSRGPNPEFHSVQKIDLGPRSKATVRKFKFLKVALEAFHTRGWLLRNVSIGKCDVKLAPLQSNCADLRETVKLKNAEGRGAGEVEVFFRLRTPLEGKDIRTHTRQFLTLHFDDAPPPSITAPIAKLAAPAGDGKDAAEADAEDADMKDAGDDDAMVDEHKPSAPASAPVKKTATAGAGAAPATPVTGKKRPRQPDSAEAESESPLPDGVLQAEVDNPLDVRLLVSNDVLDHEIKRMDEQIAALKAQGKATAELEDRRTAAEVQVQLLVAMVQNGKLTMDEYLDRLKKAIVHDQALALALQHRSKMALAANVMERVKIMQTELTTAEQNRDQLED